MEVNFRIGGKFEGTHGGQTFDPHESTYPVHELSIARVSIVSLFSGIRSWFHPKLNWSFPLTLQQHADSAVKKGVFLDLSIIVLSRQKPALLFLERGFAKIH